MKINETLKQARLNCGLSQKALAEKVGVRHATICDFENGKYQMLSGTIEKIMEILNLRISKHPAKPGSSERD